MKYAWIQEHREEFPIAVMCDVIGVARAAFYQWLKKPARVRRQRRQELAEWIRAIRSERHMDGYGSPRMTEELNARGVEVCENTVAKVMKEADLRAKAARCFVPTTT